MFISYLMDVISAMDKSLQFLMLLWNSLVIRAVGGHECSFRIVSIHSFLIKSCGGIKC